MNKTSYQILSGVTEVQHLADELSRHSQIAVDVEADSLHHYREKVCLIQVSTNQDTWLIDVLAVPNADILEAALSCAGREVVLHGGDYDIRSLDRDFSIHFAQVFDTMIAAQFIGETEIGLASLLQKYCSIRLDKKFQKADWSIRPLPADMADYAAQDTAHLLMLSRILRGRLAELGRLEWVREECGILAKNRVTEKRSGPLFLTCKGAGKLQRRNLAVLEALLQSREALAQSLDRPTFKVFSTEVALCIAEALPTTFSKLLALEKIPRGISNRFGAVLLQAVADGMALPVSELPIYPRTRGEANPGIKAKLTALKEWRSQEEEKLGLASGLIAPNWLLERIAESWPVTMSALAEITGIRHWQCSVWGERLLAFLSKGEN